MTMTEAVVDALTFPMSRDSESASRLQSIISDMLPRFSDHHVEDVLSEYITVLICNGKSQIQAKEDLDAFLGDQSWEFVACLWDLLLKYFSQGEQENLARNAVEFGSHDTPVEQGLSSRKHDDNSMNENLVSVTAPIEDIEAPISPKVEKMQMLRQVLIDSPCRRVRVKRKENKNWNSPGLNYSRKVLRSVIVSAIKEPYHDKYEKHSLDERSGILQKRSYLPERGLDSQSVHSGYVASHQERTHHVSVWDRLGKPSSNNLVRDKERPILSQFDIQSHENKVLQYGPAFPAAYRAIHSETYERKVPAVGYRHGVLQSHKARRDLDSEAITYTEPHITYNLSRKRRYGIINPNSGDFSSVLQYKQAKQEDVDKPCLLSSQSAKSDLFSEIKNVKAKLQQLELRISQSKQLKKQRVEAVKRSPQSGELQYQQDVSESKIIHVTNVHYAAKKEAISMFFSRCGAVKNVTLVTDPKGTAFVTFATEESVNKAIALSGTIFYSRPIKISRHDVSTTDS